MTASARVDEIAPNLFRISTFNPDFGIQFNQFLIKDEQPFLMHTGMRRMFEATLAGVSAVIDPKTLRWIGYSHFEPDECGALNQWLALAPQAAAVCSFVGSVVMMNDFADRPAKALADNEVLEIGESRLRFLASPHMPHGWDAGLFFEETHGSLLCSDLFFQPGDPPPLVESDVVAAARDAIAGNKHSPLANDVPYRASTDVALQRLAALSPRTLAIMHGSSYRGDGATAIRSLAAAMAELLG